MAPTKIFAWKTGIEQNQMRCDEIHGVSLTRIITWPSRRNLFGNEATDVTRVEDEGKGRQRQNDIFVSMFRSWGMASLAACMHGCMRPLLVSGWQLYRLGEPHG